MFKKIFVYLFIAVFLLVNLSISSVYADEQYIWEGDEYTPVTVAKIMQKTDIFALKAKGAVLMDSSTGSMLLEQNSHEKLPIASVTKIMSMLLIMEAIDSGKIKFEDRVFVSEHAYGMGGSQVYLKPGEEFSVKEMLEAVAIHSANDATVALGEFIAGSEDAFVGMMNEKAKQLGMNETNFLDCTGLTDEGHYSSAYDIAVMSRELVKKHPGVLEFTSTWHSTFRDGKFSLDNTNKLIRNYQGTNGLKTGFTSKAGYNLSATAKRNNLMLISVVLGEPDSNTRFAESKKLLDYGFANFEISEVNKKGEEVQNATVKKGIKASVKGIYGEDINLLLKKGEKGNVEREIMLDENVTAPVKAGQKIGEVIFRISDREVGTADVVAETDVEKASVVRLFFKMMVKWFDVGRQ